MAKKYTVAGVEFNFQPRRGQADVYEQLDSAELNVKLPTGYGKTRAYTGAFKILDHLGKVDRQLVILPTLSQLAQFVADAPSDLMACNVPGPLNVTDLGFFSKSFIQRSRSGESRVFATTIQWLAQPGNLKLARELLSANKWMVVIDEYHHYGMTKQWGRTVKSLPCAFRMALSATPQCPSDVSAFGMPHISVSYRDAVEQLAVKPLRAHSYVYRLEVVLPNGDEVTLTTNQLVAQAGGDAPEQIESFMLTREMRWSPKYISPLVTQPIERMLRDRVATGHHRLQVLVCAMCVSHAKCVFGQVRDFFPDLRVDWVGTGPDGRSAEENRAVLSQFSPPKNDRGEREPTIDVLVHAGLCGEGVDTVYVSEVTFLTSGAITNTNNQKIGRASRYLPGVVGNVNFDSSTQYAREGYVGWAIMDAMDFQQPVPDETAPPPVPAEFSELPLYPEDPCIRLYDLELDSIDSGDPEVQMYKKFIVEDSRMNVGNYTEADLLDPSSSIHDYAVEAYKNFRRREAEKHNPQVVIEALRKSVGSQLRNVTDRILRTLKAAGRVLPGDAAGQIKRQLNSRKAELFGAVDNDAGVLKSHYRWLWELDKSVKEQGVVPTWLQFE